MAVPPEPNHETGWIERITITHLAIQTAGFEKPGGCTKQIFEPGTKWAYSDGGPNWLTECLTPAYKRGVSKLMFEQVFAPLEIAHEDLTWRQNSCRQAKIDGGMRREFGSDISANVVPWRASVISNLRGGQWNGKQIIPQAFVAAASTAVASVIGLPEDPEHYDNTSDHYGLLGRTMRVER